MKSTAKHEAQQPQHEEEPAKKKSRKRAKAKHTTSPQSNEARAEPPPMASSSAIETTNASDSLSRRKALGLSDLPCNAAQEAFNEIVKAHAIFQKAKRRSHATINPAWTHNAKRVAYLPQALRVGTPCTDQNTGPDGGRNRATQPPKHYAGLGRTSRALRR